MRLIGRNGGMTLVEVLVGLAVLMIGVIPMLHFWSIQANTARVRDLYEAAAVLKGEVKVMYATNMLPPPQQKIKANGVEYAIQTSSENDACLSRWRLGVIRQEKELAVISGILYQAGVPCK